MSERTRTRLWGLLLAGYLLLIVYLILLPPMAEGQEPPPAPLNWQNALEKATQGQEEETPEEFWDRLFPAEEEEKIRAPRLRSLAARMGIGSRPGAGYLTPPGSVAVWRCGRTLRFEIDTEVEPWRADGTRKEEWVSLMAQRYCGGQATCQDEARCPQGAYAETVDWNRESLGNACRAGALEPGDWTCVARSQEIADLQVRERRCGPWYHEWRHQQRPGGTPENAIIVDQVSFESFYRRTMDSNGICSLGMVSAGEQQNLCGWGTWYDVQYLPPEPPWCSPGTPDPPPPPPPPPPEPEPEPDPPPVQTCMPGEECRPPCPECPGFPEECSELASLVEIHARQLETVRGMVREQCIAALPDGTWRQVDDGRYCKAAPGWLLAQVAKTEALLLEAREECRGSERRFVPGIPSTGKSPVELTEGEGR